MNRALVCSWVAAIGIALTLPACGQHIGSSCTQSTDCSSRGDRVCDTSQQGGYCTVFGCGDKTCPDHAACVTFNAALPGCSYNDYQAPARTSRTLCLAHCQRDSDCRESEGYVCRDPREAPWSATIVDDNQGQQVCVVAASVTDAAPAPAPAVCSAGQSPADAHAADSANLSDSSQTEAAPPLDAGVEDAADAG